MVYESHQLSRKGDTPPECCISCKCLLIPRFLQSLLSQFFSALGGQVKGLQASALGQTCIFSRLLSCKR